MVKLGINKHPAVIHVQSQERAEEILSLCDQHGWKVIIGIEPDKPENISDIEKLINPPSPAKTGLKIGRNDSCPCGSGKKYKKCCLKNATKKHMN